jgi:hypothetical protein
VTWAGDQEVWITEGCFQSCLAHPFIHSAIFNKDFCVPDNTPSAEERTRQSLSPADYNVEVEANVNEHKNQCQILAAENTPPTPKRGIQGRESTERKDPGPPEVVMDEE